jgi:hypothetical protein
MDKKEIYKSEGDTVVINWRKLNESRILSPTELNILYMLMDKIDANQEKGKIKWMD